MKLESLHVYRRGWNNDGKVTGSVKFKNDLGEIELNLDEQACQEILAICADSLVAVSREVHRLHGETGNGGMMAYAPLWLLVLMGLGCFAAGVFLGRISR